MTALDTHTVHAIVALCKAHYVTAISVFGSAAQNRLNAESDIDFLVRFSEDLNLLDYADNYFSLLDGLEKITGRRVDLISEKSLRNPVFIEEISKSRIDLYVK
ncbi:MAG: hypothetical protein Fur0041_06590 [Bacteroidia bacterium]